MSRGTLSRNFTAKGLMLIADVIGRVAAGEESNSA